MDQNDCQIREYIYQDEFSQPLYRITRTREKKFFSHRWINTRWELGLGDCRRVLYRLPDILANKTGHIFVVEGEKDADTLRSCGLLSTTGCGGAGNWREEYAPYFKDRICYVIPDNDSVGYDHAEEVCQSIFPFAAVVKLLVLPDLPEKGDVTDWIRAGNRGDTLAWLANAIEPYTPPQRPVQKQFKSKLFLEPIVDKPDVLEIASTMMDLTERHDGWWGRCPFHDEKTPSFKVFKDRRGFYCFGCHKRGDGYDLLMHKTGQPFRNVVVSRKLGVDPSVIQMARELIGSWISLYNSLDSMSKIDRESSRFQILKTTYDNASSNIAIILSNIGTSAVNVQQLDLGALYRTCPKRVREIIKLPIMDQMGVLVEYTHAIENLESSRSQ